MRLTPLALLGFATAASGQSAIVGRVVENGVPVPSAGVTATRSDSSIARETITTADGRFRLAPLTAGLYTVTVRKVGYRSATEEAIRVAAAQTVTLDVSLTRAPRQLSTIVVVSSPTSIDVSTAALSTRLERQVTELLPTARDASSLIALVPGARTDQLWGGAAGVSNDYRLDGVSMNHPGLGGDFLSLSVDWMEAVDIRGLGAGAENGNFQGGVINATVRSLKMHGGADKKTLGVENLGALERGLPNLEKHIENVKHFGVPGVVAINRRSTDTDAELQMISDFCAQLGVPSALTEVFEKGGAGGEALGTELLALLDKKGAEYRPLYPADLPIKQKIDIIVRQIYGGDGADYSPAADRAIDYLESIGLGGTPVCMAKTQYSFGDDPTKLGRPRGFRIQVNEVRASAGAGFVVAQCGDIMTMPGLPKEPAAERMARLPSGEIVGLF